MISRFTAQITTLTIGSLAAAYTLAFSVGTRTPNLAQKYAGWSIVGLGLIGGAVLLVYTLQLLAASDPRPLEKVLAKVRRWLTPVFLADKILPIFLVFGFLAAFSVFKSLIPFVQPFAWDAFFSDLDRLIFGTDPWRIANAFIGPLESRLLDYAYVMWAPVFTCVVFYHSVFAGGEQKRRFFLAFFGCWIVLGIVCAMIFSSAGPCFLELIHHPYASRYPLFPLENGHYSQRIMDYLAEGYLTGDYGTAKGISAMPSMHIAVVTLYLLTARRWWTIAFSAVYFVLIFVGSVALGWHYAVDGIFGALGTIVIYLTTSIANDERSRVMSTDMSFRPEEQHQISQSRSLSSN